MNNLGICFRGIAYGAPAIFDLRKICKRNKLLLWADTHGQIKIRPDTVRNREIMERENESERVKAGGRF